MSSLLEMLEQNRVSTRTQTRRIADVLRDIEEGKITIPDYQRNFVWDVKTQSRFIESILLNVPVPPIFISENIDIETSELKQEVIDGSQRLRTLLKFKTGNLRLKSLEKLKNYLENKKVSDFEPGIPSNYFLNRDINIIIIERNTAPDIQYDIFERLNQGSVSLLPQELRNCIFHGEFNDFLLKLRLDPIYLYLMENFSNYHFVKIENNFDTEDPQIFKKDKVRLGDVEMILRFFALYESYQVDEKKEYRAPKKEFLNNYMNYKAKKINPEIYYLNNQDLKTIFLRAVNNVKKVFKGNHFKRYALKNNKYSWLKLFNKGVFDLQMLSLLRFTDDFIDDNRKIIYYSFIDISKNNQLFNETLNSNTDNQINERLDLWINYLNEVFDNKKEYLKNLDLLSQNIKSYNCRICKKEIETIEEAELENDSVVHSACKPRKSDFIPSDWEKPVIESINNQGTLGNGIFNFIKKNSPISSNEIDQYVEDRGYKTGNQIRNILSVLNKYFQVKKYGVGDNATYEYNEDFEE